MSDLDKMKKKLELMKIQAAKYGYEVKIEERLKDIDRIKKEIEIVEARELELSQEIDNG